MIAARLKLNRDYNGRPCREFIELGPSSSQHLTKWFSALQIQFTYLIIFLLELILPTSRRIWYVKVLKKSKRCSPVHTHKNVLSYGYLVCGLSSHTLSTLVFVPQPKIQIIITILSLTTYLAILSLIPQKRPNDPNEGWKVQQCYTHRGTVKLVTWSIMSKRTLIISHNFRYFQNRLGF